jgi:hypothetical protein
LGGVQNCFVFRLGAEVGKTEVRKLRGFETEVFSPPQRTEISFAASADATERTVSLTIF